MAILTFENLSKSFGTQACFEKISGKIEPRDRIGLIGANGTGKTTLLKCLTGEITPEDGAVRKGKELRIQVLSQDPKLDPNNTLREETMTAFASLLALEKKIHEISEQMAEPDCDADRMEALLAEMGDVQTKFEALDGYTVDSQVDAVLYGVGFTKEDFDKPASGLSGGERSRVGLAKVLLGKPDLIVLDEPTNHLDIWGVQWLERFLVDDFEGAVLIVSHDRFFLDVVTTNTWEIERAKLLCWPGNYTKSRRLKTEDFERRQREWEQQQRTIANQEDFIRKNMAGQRTREAQGRLKRLERFKRDEAITRPIESKKGLRVTFATEKRTGADVVKVNNLKFGYAETPLFEDLTFELIPGEKLGIVGPNGAGKSTLVRCMLGEIEPQDGSVRQGITIEPAILAQRETFAETDQTIVDHIQRFAPRWDEPAVRDLLGMLLFSGQDAYKSLSVLSGGEKKRVALAKILMGDANLLYLDEPTNHLDLPSCEALESALDGYNGTIVVVSHDRYLLDKLCDRVLWMAPKHGFAFPEDAGSGPENRVFVGNYSDMVTRVREERAARNEAAKAKEKAAAKKTAPQKTQAKQVKARVKRTFKGTIGQLESEIEKLADEMKEIESQLADVEIYNDADKVKELTERYDKLRGKHIQYEEEWLERADS